jgi:hypothetical protein
MDHAPIPLQEQVASPVASEEAAQKVQPDLEAARTPATANVVIEAQAGLDEEVCSGVLLEGGPARWSQVHARGPGVRDVCYVGSIEHGHVTAPTPDLVVKRRYLKAPSPCVAESKGHQQAVFMSIGACALVYERRQSA